MNFMGEKLEAHFLAKIMYTYIQLKKNVYIHTTKKNMVSELKPEMKKSINFFAQKPCYVMLTAQNKYVHNRHSLLQHFNSSLIKAKKQKYHY